MTVIARFVVSLGRSYDTTRGSRGHCRHHLAADRLCDRADGDHDVRGLDGRRPRSPTATPAPSWPQALSRHELRGARPSRRSWTGRSMSHYRPVRLIQPVHRSDTFYPTASEYAGGLSVRAGVPSTRLHRLRTGTVSTGRTTGLRWPSTSFRALLASLRGSRRTINGSAPTADPAGACALRTVLGRHADRGDTG